MEDQFNDQFNALIEKYTELLTGKTDQDLQEKIQYWALYTYIAKSMPSLVKHWNEKYPEGKKEMLTLIGEIKQQNDEHRVNQKK